MNHHGRIKTINLRGQIGLGRALSGWTVRVELCSDDRVVLHRVRIKSPATDAKAAKAAEMESALNEIREREVAQLRRQQARTAAGGGNAPSGSAKAGGGASAPANAGPRSGGDPHRQGPERPETIHMPELPSRERLRDRATAAAAMFRGLDIYGALRPVAAAPDATQRSAPSQAQSSTTP